MTGSPDEWERRALTANHINRWEGNWTYVCGESQHGKSRLRDIRPGLRRTTSPETGTKRQTWTIICRELLCHKHRVRASSGLYFIRKYALLYKASDKQLRAQVEPMVYAFWGWSAYDLFYSTECVMLYHPLTYSTAFSIKESTLLFSTLNNNPQ